MAKISGSVNASTGLLFQLLASLGSFLIGAKGTDTTATGVVGMKLDLAAVEATAGGKEGTVIWAKRADGRVARTNWSGATGAAAAAMGSTTGAVAGIGATTFLTVIDFASGTGVAFFKDDTGATLALALAAGVGLEAATTDLGAGAAAFVLTAGALEETPVVFILGWALATGGAALGLDAALALLTGLTAVLVLPTTVFLANDALTARAFFTCGALTAAAFLAGTFLAGAVLAGASFLAAAALAEVVFTGAATFFFGVVTSCLLAA